MCGGTGLGSPSSTSLRANRSPELLHPDLLVDRVPLRTPWLDVFQLEPEHFPAAVGQVEDLVGLAVDKHDPSATAGSPQLLRL